MRSGLALGTLAVMLVYVAPSRAQERSCELEIETAPGSRSRYTRLADGGSRLDAGGGVQADCGETRVRADSATYFEDRGELYLYRNVTYWTPERRLTSSRATYYAEEERVIAEGDVRLTNRADGSVLTGPVLHYYPATERRPVERVFAPQRPHLTFYSDPDAAPDSGRFDIDADRVHLYGDSLMAGAGSVEIRRDEMAAFGDSLDLDLAADRLRLLGEPRVDAEGTTLEGDTIVGVLQERRIRELRAWPDASARGEELALDAPTIRLFVEDGVIVRVVAFRGLDLDPAVAGDSALALAGDTLGPVGDSVVVSREEPLDSTAAVNSPARPADEGSRAEFGAAAAAPADSLAGARSARARAESDQYVLTSDSIDVRRPGGVLERLIAVGGARATTREPVDPEDAVMGYDWLQGDTIRGYFGAAGDTSEAADPGEAAVEPETPGAMADSVGAAEDPQAPEPTSSITPAVPGSDGTARADSVGQPRLRRLVALGRARSLYHLRQDEGGGDADRPAINYVKGRIVTIWLEDGEVTHVDVDGPGRGVYLEPVKGAQPADSAAADAEAAVEPEGEAAPADTTRLAPDTTATTRLRPGRGPARGRP